MNNGNGKWIRWLVGILFTIIFTAITTLTANVIANDKDTRAREDKIKEEMTGAIKDQMLTNQQILVALARIETVCATAYKDRDGKLKTR